MINSRNTTTYPEVDVLNYQNGSVQMRTMVRQLGQKGQYYLTEVSILQGSKYAVDILKQFTTLVYRQLLDVPGDRSHLDENQEDELKRLKSVSLPTPHYQGEDEKV